MLRLDGTLVDVGKGLNNTSMVNVAQLLPSSKGGRASISRMAYEKRATIKGVIRDTMECGGGITCDALKKPVKWNMYY